MSKRIHNGKQAMLARKEEILKELKYYEKRIDDARSKTNNSFYDESSDSEQEFTVELEPSISELKLKQSMLQTCLFATQELTGVQILQSEVNIMVNEPVFEKEPPVNEAGVWKEVTAECRVDLVPFSMTFYVHQPNRPFGSPQYRCLQITPVKRAHEQELALSVLPTVKTPSDAVEVLRSYARAHRSRRSSLARLAEKYADTLFMEPMPEGGYILKCANLLEVSWTLQNKGSPIAPFHHRLKFDLEYMDESYIKIITQAHRQLSDPAVETDERTLLLAKIINTCLQARKDMPINESESDTDKLTDKNSETNVKDSEIMAPPKTIPKKVKSVKRRNEDGGGTSKKAKIDNKENFSDNNRGRDDLNTMIENDLKSYNVNEIDKQMKKTIKSKNDGSTKESSGRKNSNANNNVAPKSNVESNLIELKDGNTDSGNKKDGKDINSEKVVKKSKISSKTDNKEAKINLMKENKTNDKNSKDQHNDAKAENKNSVANSTNEKNKKDKKKKDTEVTNDVNSKSEIVSSKNDKINTKNKDGSNKMDKNEILNKAKDKDSQNKNANNKKGNMEIANDINSKTENATTKNDKNKLNNVDVNDEMDTNEITSEANSKSENTNLKNNKDNLKYKNSKSNKETKKATNDTNSENDKNNLKNKNVSNKQDTNELSKDTKSKSETASSKMNKDNLKSKNINNKSTKEVVNGINSNSENVKTLNSIDKEAIIATTKNKNVAKSDAKTKNINNVVSKKVDNNTAFTKSNDKNDVNKKQNINEKNNLKTKLNPENVGASKKSKTELINDKNAVKIQKNSTIANKKESTTNIEKIKTQSLMQRFSKPNSVANKPNIASNKKIISPKIMKNKTNINTKITVMKNILSVSKQSDENSSKIPQRIKSSDIKKNILRLSPRFIKKPSVMPKI